MSKYKLYIMAQCYNELDKGNLERFFQYSKDLVDGYIIYDDASTDGSYEYMRAFTNYIIRAHKNDFKNEITHKQLLLDKAYELNVDFLLWLDIDEILSQTSRVELDQICDEMLMRDLDAYGFPQINLWHSKTWQRLDSSFGDGRFIRLWSLVKKQHYFNVSKGLHGQLYPTTIKNIAYHDRLHIIHYAFANKKNIAYKYWTYKYHGQRGYEMLNRIIFAHNLNIEQVSSDLIPTNLYDKNEPRPTPTTYLESLYDVYQWRDIVDKANISFIAIADNIVNVKMIYEKILRFTNMRDKNILFIVNKTNNIVKDYLSYHYIPYYIFDDIQQHRHINDLWLYAAKMAKGKYVILVNADMKYYPNWYEDTLAQYHGNDINNINTALPLIFEKSYFLDRGGFSPQNNQQDTIYYHDITERPENTPIIAICHGDNNNQNKIQNEIWSNLSNIINISDQTSHIDSGDSQHIEKYINQYYPDIKIIIQDDSMDIIDTDKFTIIYLSDNHTAINQKRLANLKKADMIIADNVSTALHHDDFIIDIIPFSAEKDNSSTEKTLLKQWQQLLEKAMIQATQKKLAYDSRIIDDYHNNPRIYSQFDVLMSHSKLKALKYITVKYIVNMLGNTPKIYNLGRFIYRNLLNKF